MKNLVTVLFLILILNEFIFPQEKFQFVSPADNAKLVSLSTNIIASSKDEIDFNNLSSDIIIIKGEKSGIHNANIKLSDDKKTLIFIPLNKFEPDENVVVNIKSGIRTIDGNILSSISFRFTTTPLSKPIKLNPFSTVDNSFTGGKALYKNAVNYLTTAQNINSDTIPADFPKITIDSINNPSPGKIFMANFPLGASDSTGHFLMIVNNDGTVDSYKRLDNPGFDFKVQPDGNLSYADVIEQIGGYANVRWIVLDTSLAPIDTFQCGNGYTADLHDFKLLPNGHAVLMAYDPEPVDMSQVVDGGDPNATVLGCIIQELDSKKNVIFQWRSWDYIPITDSYEKLTGKTVDYTHMNAVDVDKDGNFYTSFRHLSQIVKVERATGNIIWKLGGKGNEFTFINENEENSPNYFSYQHDISVLTNGNITLFDNGNQHSPQYSRAVEYKLNEANKTAELVWEYRHSPDIFTLAMGTVQRLPNGNTLIGWGSAGMNGDPSVTEVHPDNSTAFELTLPVGETSYRSFRFPWKSQLPEVSVTNYEILEGNTYDFDSQDDTTGISIKINQINGLLYTKITATVYNYAPVNPKFVTNAPHVAKKYFSLEGTSISSFEGEVHIKLNYQSEISNPQNTIVYLRTQSDSSFEALATSYNASKNEIIFTTNKFGDIIFGVPINIDSSYSPVPIKPQDNEIVNEEDPVNLVWGTRGIVSNYQIQVSKDSLFNSIIINDTISSTAYEINGLDNNTKYSWRVRANNLSGESDWSETTNFLTSSPYITVLYPNGSEEFFGDSTYIIRWQDNLSDMVNISLFKNNTLSLVLADSIISETNAFSWQVPDSVQKDSVYKIKITDLKDKNVFDASDGNFIINTIAVGVNKTNNVVKNYKLYHNYPNPFNPSTVIKYDLPKTSRVTISIFNVIGQRIAVLVKEIQNEGTHQVIWNAKNIASGVYFYKIKATGINNKDEFVSFKKAVLIK